MNSIRLALALALAGTSLTAWPQSGPGTSPYRFVFTATDAGQVFQTIGLKLGANIVYSVSEPVVVTLNVSVSSVEQAIQSAAAAAGLSFRKVGSTYVIAKPDEMRRVLQPYGLRATYTLKSMTASDVVKYLEEAIPMLTLRPAGAVIVAIGLPEDLALAADLIKKFETDEQIAPAPQRTSAVVRLEHASPQEVAAVLATVYPELKVATVGAKDATGGAIGLAGPSDQVELASKLIRGLDTPQKTVERDLAFRVYEVRYSSAPVLKELVETAVPEVSAIVGPEPYSPMQPVFRPIGGAVSGQSGSSSGSISSAQGGMAGGASSSGSAGGGGGGGSQPYQKVQEGDRAKTLVLRGPEWAVTRALALIQDLDRKPIQVRVHVHVVDSSPVVDTDTGFKHSWTTFPFFEAPPGTPVDDVMTKTRPAGFGQFSRVPWSFEALFNAITTQKDSKLLANPSIQVIDNDDATIFIGDTIRARIAQAGSLGSQTVEIREFPVGIILLLRPRVNDDGNITMRVHPVVSTLTAVDSQNVPQTSSREAETTIMMKDGETVVIGGLIRDEYTRTVQEIPLLSQIPILGELFRNRSTRSRKSEILVYITTTIVKDDSPTADSGGL